MFRVRKRNRFIRSTITWLSVITITTVSLGPVRLAASEEDEPPVITSTPVTDGMVGVLYEYDVDASGTPAPTYALIASPSEMTINAETGLINWTPSSPGHFGVNVQAANSVGSFLQTFEIYVIPVPDGPTITSSPPTSANVGQAYNYDVNATGSPVPSYSLLDNPVGMSIDPASGIIDWVPSLAGLFDVSVQATNSEGTDQQDYSLRVYEVPIITSTPDTETVVGDYYSYQVVATGDPTPALALTLFPAGMTFDNGTGLIEWTPTVAGDYDVTVQAGNPGGTAKQSYVLHVSEIIVAPSITSSPPTSAIVDQYFSYTVTATGLPDPTYVLTLFPSGMTIDSSNGLIEWTPPLAGDFDVTVEARNSAGADQQSFSVSVNQIPAFTSQPETLAVLGELYLGDVDAQGRPSPTYVLTQFPSEMTINNVTGLINWNPLVEGDYDITVEAVNSVGSDELNFVIEVVAAESPFITSIPATNAPVGQLYSYDVEATGIPDPTYALIDYPVSMTIDSLSGLIQWTPDETGSFSVNVQARNIAGNYSQGFILDIVETYQAPLITSSPEMAAIVGQLYAYNVDATGSPVPTFSLIEHPEEMVIDAQTGLIQWTPSVRGIHVVTIEAVNSVGNDSQNFLITVSCCGAYTNGYTGNANCSADGRRNLADITRIIDRVYISKAQLCCEENGNVDGDEENNLNLSDITRLIDHVYLSKEELVACE